MAQLCQQQLPAVIPPRGPGSGGGLPGSPLLLLLFLLASSVRVCKGVPMPSQVLEAEQELQLWKEEKIMIALNEVSFGRTDQDKQKWYFVECLGKPYHRIDDACSTYMSADSQPQVSSTLEEVCFLVMGFLQKPQGLNEKDNMKRFLFHYSKTHDSGNSDVRSSVLHPLLQLVPQLNERRLKRYKVDEDLQGAGGIQSRGYFFFRPRNGKRSVDFH